MADPKKDLGGSLEIKKKDDIENKEGALPPYIAPGDIDLKKKEDKKSKKEEVEGVIPAGLNIAEIQKAIKEAYKIQDDPKNPANTNQSNEEYLYIPAEGLKDPDGGATQIATIKHLESGVFVKISATKEGKETHLKVTLESNNNNDKEAVKEALEDMVQKLAEVIEKTKGSKFVFISSSSDANKKILEEACKKHGLTIVDGPQEAPDENAKKENKPEEKEETEIKIPGPSSRPNGFIA